MLLFINNNIEKYARRLRLWSLKFFDPGIHLRYSTVDFDKSFWRVITTQKRLLFLITLIRLIFKAYYACIVLAITWLLTIGSWEFVYIFAVISLAVVLIGQSSWLLMRLYSNNIVASTVISAKKKLMHTDPVNHTHRELGTILSRVEKGSEAFKSVIDVVAMNFLGFILDLLVLIVGFGYFSWLLGLYVTVTIVILASINIGFSSWNKQVFAPYSNRASDDLNNSFVEALSQFSLIRSTFSTQSQVSKIHTRAKKSAAAFALQWRGEENVHLITNFVALILNCGLVWLVFAQVADKQVGSLTATGLLLAYFINSTHLQYIGNHTRKFFKAVQSIEAMWELIRTYGIQTYPVTHTDKVSPISSNLSTKQN